MSDLLEEIKEDIRQEQLEKFWEKYKAFVISAIAAILVGTGGYVLWQNWKENQTKVHATDFTKALQFERDGQLVEAEKTFLALAKSSDGYAILAKFRLINMALQGMTTSTSKNSTDNAIEKAIEALMMLERDGKIDAIYRDYACLLHAYVTLDQGDPDYLLQKIEPVTYKGNPWRPLALELKAVLLHKKGDIQAATALFKELEMDAPGPQAFKMRVQALARRLSEGLQATTPQAQTPPSSN